MASDEDKAKLRFELANENFQSVSRAQGLYLSALLIYVCLVWALFFTPSGEAVTLHFGWLELKMDGVWKVTPFVTMVLTLAVAGTLNAAVSTFAELQSARKELLGSQFGAMFDVDKHKNVIDYLALLQILPWGKTRKPAEDRGSEPAWRRLHHLIFPALFALSCFTSYRAVRELSGLGSAGHAVMIYGWICFGVQATFSVRPVWRGLRRFFGAERTDDVYN